MKWQGHFRDCPCWYPMSSGINKTITEAFAHLGAYLNNLIMASDRPGLQATAAYTGGQGAGQERPRCRGQRGGGGAGRQQRAAFPPPGDGARSEAENTAAGADKTARARRYYPGPVQINGEKVHTCEWQDLVVGQFCFRW